MAKIINVESSKYINENIQIFAKQKIGQYSKFLNKNPMYVTYLPINHTMSRADVGTGGIDTEIGPTSPIRYNRINNLPVYNMPEIQPDITFDESGTDISIDLSGLALLPGTIKPTPGDYLILSFPGIREFLFRVTNIAYNTIQSNDFYVFDADVKDIGVDVLTRVLPQIVETYDTVFENIGTQDRCFIRTEDVVKANNLARIMGELEDFYKATFFNQECNAFILYRNPDEDYRSSWLYDPYLEKFILRSSIYYQKGDTAAFLLTPNDMLPIEFDYMFKRTLQYAVLNRTMDYICPFTYYYQSSNMKRCSPFFINDYACNTVNLFLTDHNLFPEPVPPIDPEPEPEPPVDPDMSVDPEPEAPEGETRIRNNGIIGDIASNGGRTLYEYYSKDLIDDIQAGQGLRSTDYLEIIIYNYFNNITTDVEKAKILPYTFNHSAHTFLHMPLVLFILSKYYEEYFKTEADI